MIRFVDSLANKLSSLGNPLWPSVFADVHVGLFRLLMESNVADALCVLQLGMVLLSEIDRDRLHKLIVFLREASNIGAVQLSVLVS